MTVAIENLSTLDLALLNDWQRDFPLVTRPFDVIAARYGHTSAAVQARYQHLMQCGALSRIGGIFGVGAGGSAMLCALAVPPDRLDTVAQQVNQFEYVNHNYAREHHWNLWFVVTAPSATDRDACVSDIEAQTCLRALRLPMRRAFRIDLGFDLKTGHCQAAQARRCAPIDTADHALAAAIESGMPLIDRPYAQWAEQAGCTEALALLKIEQWLNAGALRRMGAIVRHHELGVNANAMTVFNVPEDQFLAYGQELARQPGVTLCYARQRDEGWPYNLYCMVHGRTEAETRAHIAHARQRTGLDAFDHAVLFSTHRYKQTGGRYFRSSTPRQPPTQPILAAA
jgi:DNA-binding Lrp family transcriptional regulator